MSTACCAVVVLAFEPAWLALSRPERGQWAARIAEITARHAKVKLSWFDSDALGNGYNDFVLCHFDNLLDYHFLWEELRDTELFSRPYVRIVNVLPGIERAYEASENRP